MRKSRIICTIGPATDDVEMIKKLIAGGMDIARLNFSHGTHEEHAARIEKIRQAARESGAYTGIMLDTKGPEIRTGEMEGGSVDLEEGQTYEITTDGSAGDSRHCSVTYKGLPKCMKEGDRMLFDDGLIEMTVLETGKDRIVCRVENEGELGSRKGVNIPGIKTDLPAMSDKDKADILFGIEQGVDFYALSFVRSPEDVVEVRTFIRKNGQEHPFIISKIESREALRCIGDIIDVSDGVMVARGDLGVEIPVEQVPAIQKEIIKECNEKGKSVITATQMLESMIHNPRPTRAEAGDISNAILDGTDATMLSGETAMGEYPVESVKMMSTIAEAAEEQMKRRDVVMSHVDFRRTTNAVAAAAYQASESLDTRAIVCPTTSGHTALTIAGYRPQTPIIGISRHEEILRRLSICWGTVPVKAHAKEGAAEDDDSEDIFEYAVRTVLEAGIVEEGQRIIILAGLPKYLRNNTNTMRIHIVGEPI